MDMDGKICSVKFVTQSHFQASEMWTELDLMFLLYEWDMASPFEQKGYTSSTVYKRFMGNKYDVAAELTKEFKSIFPKIWIKWLAVWH